jgi:2'-5' RNA ligase
MPKATDLRSLVDRHRDTLVGEGRLDRVVLYRSLQGPDGSAYHPLHTVRLGEP